MKPEHDFKAERILARHCEALLPAAPPERDLVGGCAELASDLARALTPYLTAVAGGAGLTISCGEASRTNTTAFINRLGRKSAHGVIDAAGGSALLVSIDHAAALALTDRAYGGTGEIPDPLPETLPLSADLTLRQLEAACCSGLARVFPDAPAPAVSRRGADLGRLDPFRGKAECVHFDLVVAQEGQEPWTLVLAASLPDMQRMIDGTMPAAQNVVAAPVANDPLAEPFGDIPLPAIAVLAALPLPLARLSALAVGDMIPLAIARQVPLQIGGTTIALGTIGAQDDCVALQITRRF